MSILGFLKNVTIEEIKEEPKKDRTAKKDRNPNPLFIGFRLWKDGSIYPSQALVDKFELEYQTGKIEIVPAKEATPAVGVEGEKGYKPAKEAVPESTRVVSSDKPGNGFDFIDSRSWGQYKGEGKIAFIGVVPKNLPKVDLFGSTVYDKEGKPKSSVMDQGAVTFGSTILIPAIKELYGVELNEEKEFVDLAVLEEVEGININQAFSRPIALVPKKISRGGDKGKDDYERRENMPLYALVPQELVEASANRPSEEEETIENSEAEVEQEGQAEDEGTTETPKTGRGRPKKATV